MPLYNSYFAPVTLLGLLIGDTERIKRCFWRSGSSKMGTKKVVPQPGVTQWLTQLTCVASAICPQPASSFTVPTAEVEISTGLFITLFSNHTSCLWGRPRLWPPYGTRPALSHPRVCWWLRCAGEGTAWRVTRCASVPLLCSDPREPCETGPALSFPAYFWAFLSKFGHISSEE